MWPRRIAAGAVMAAAIAIYAIGAVQSPVWNEARYREQVYLMELIAAGPTGEAEADAQALAEAYWRRYPDVAADAVYGVDGSLGVQGAHTHYRQHGRFEGRIWGLE